MTRYEYAGVLLQWNDDDCADARPLSLSTAGMMGDITVGQARALAKALHYAAVEAERFSSGYVDQGALDERVGTGNAWARGMPDLVPRTDTVNARIAAFEDRESRMARMLGTMRSLEVQLADLGAMPFETSGKSAFHALAEWRIWASKMVRDQDDGSPPDMDDAELMRLIGCMADE